MVEHCSKLALIATATTAIASIPPSRLRNLIAGALLDAKEGERDAGS